MDRRDMDPRDRGLEGRSGANTAIRSASPGVGAASWRLLDHHVGRVTRVFGHVATPSALPNTRGVPISFMFGAGPHGLGHLLDEPDVPEA